MAGCKEDGEKHHGGKKEKLLLKEAGPQTLLKSDHDFPPVCSEPIYLKIKKPPQAGEPVKAFMDKRLDCFCIGAYPGDDLLTQPVHNSIKNLLAPSPVTVKVK
jgi:hypothetical protein